MTTTTRDSLRGKARRFVNQLSADVSGLAMVEFAFAAPLVLSMGMLGTDTAMMVITHLQVSQIAMQAADNASRVGEQDVLTARKVFERDIAETLIGVEKLGEDMNFFAQGRVIISSLQRNAQGGQWIAWQRCRGAKVFNSSYGVQGNGATGTGFPGMGVPGRYITASQGTAVIFVEVAYDYDSPLPLELFDGQQIVYTAAYNVRDNRDLTQLYPGGPEARCSTYSAARPT
ncbi:TadE/TadG family type IV pilus assembly protein [Porphyrobacter sp. ULC335]|uniref:TadE/TadG family type IV pilus assembly protein n=1 Tax=Porphyrobacter sp. ULC335 TaxID=2854260 RepID=UPI002220B986|nr:TadE family protein [Porphyrobacter sp. ULC335]UYV14844.1 pilus assembly protein [Porphyrobacter sp. ULC335]